MPGAFGAADPLFLLLAALAAEAYLGSFEWGLGGLSWPRRRFAELLRALQRRLDRPQRGRAALTLRGGLLAGAVLLAALAGGQALALFTRHYPFAWALELLLLFGALRLRRSHRQAERVQEALERGDAQAARAALALLAAADLPPQRVEALPPQALAATTAAALERRLADGGLAPSLWFVLLGLPGLLAWVAVQRARLVLAGPALAGGGAVGSEAFGRPPASLYRLLRWPAERLGEALHGLAARLRADAPPAVPGELLEGALARHRLASLLLAVGVLLLIVLRLLLRSA